MIITGAASVSRDIEYIPNTGGGLRVDDGMYVASLNELADAVHDFSAKIALQLSGGRGRIAPPRYLKAIGAVAPSPVSCYWDPEVLARELRTEQIERLVQAFVPRP